MSVRMTNDQVNDMFLKKYARSVVFEIESVETSLQIMQVERIFLTPNGIPDITTTKHLLFATPSFTTSQEYAMTFPGIYHILQKVTDLEEKKPPPTAEQKQTLLDDLKNQLKRHLTEIIVAIHQATIHLQHFSRFSFITA